MPGLPGREIPSRYGTNTLTINDVSLYTYTVRCFVVNVFSGARYSRLASGCKIKSGAENRGSLLSLLWHVVKEFSADRIARTKPVEKNYCWFWHIS